MSTLPQLQPCYGNFVWKCNQYLYFFWYNKSFWQKNANVWMFFRKVITMITFVIVGYVIDFKEGEGSCFFHLLMREYTQNNPFWIELNNTVSCRIVSQIYALFILVLPYLFILALILSLSCLLLERWMDESTRWEVLPFSPNLSGKFLVVSALFSNGGGW